MANMYEMWEICQTAILKSLQQYCILCNSDYLLLGITMDTRKTVASSNQLVSASGIG